MLVVIVKIRNIIISNSENNFYIVTANVMNSSIGENHVNFK